MFPQVGALPGFVVGWTLAAALAGGTVTWLMRRQGLSMGQITAAFALFATAVVIGSKALYLIERWPEWIASSAELKATLLSERMRVPGGFVLAAAMIALVARLVGVRPLWLADIVSAPLALCIFGVRIACFLEGCCYGTPSSLPWAVRFPPSSAAYRGQLQQGLISFSASETLPIHPLQLYFAAAGLLIFAAVSAYEPRKRYEGEAFLLFAFTYCWSSWALELLRAQPHDLTRQLLFVCGIAAAAVAALAEWRLRQGGGAACTPTEHARPS